MWSIASLRPATLSHKHGQNWLSRVWFFFWMKPLLVESVIGWEIHWMKKFLDECSLDETAFGWKCQNWMKVFWMKVSVDENAFGWKCHWMKTWFQRLLDLNPPSLPEKRSILAPIFRWAFFFPSKKNGRFWHRWPSVMSRTHPPTKKRSILAPLTFPNVKNNAGKHKSTKKSTENVFGWNFQWMKSFLDESVFYRPKWFYRTTNQEQLSGFWKHVSLSGFFPWKSSWSLLRGLNTRTTNKASWWEEHTFEGI